MVRKNNAAGVYLFKTLSDTVPRRVTWEEIAAALRDGRLKSCCDEYRRLAALAAGASDGEKSRLKSMMSRIKHTLPSFVASAELDGGRSGKCVRGYTGYVMADFDHIPPERLAAAGQALKADPHTLLSYVTVSGCGLRVIARVSCEVTAETFPHVWKTVNGYFAAVAGVPFDRQCSNATRMSCLSHDPAAIYNPGALPVDVPPPAAAPEKRKGRPRKTAAEVAGRSARTMVEREGAEYVAGGRNKYVSRCIYWMNRFGIGAGQTLEWALKEFADYNAANGGPLPGIVDSIYRNHADEHGTQSPSAGRTRARNMAALREMEQWLSGRYRIRRNAITQYVEISDVAKGCKFTELSDVLENSIWCDMLRDGISVDMPMLRALLQSDFVPAYNPLRLYLDTLPPWDGTTDHIGRFLAMVHCKGVEPGMFDFYARRWLVGMISSVLDEKAVNHEILVLLGRQGTYKTSFMNSILPPCLRRYYCVKTNAQRMGKDDALALTENILINMEEIDTMTRSEVNQLKAMASIPYINERPPYGRNKVRLPHIASFCATGNNLQFLTDNTGNRRWLVFEIESIDNPLTASICYEGIYAQLKSLYEAGFKYWFDGEEIAALNKANMRFEAPDMERELIVSHYRKPAPYEPCLYLSSSQIVARFSPQLRLSAVNVGRVMSELSFSQVRTSAGRFWKVAEVPIASVGRFVPADAGVGDDAPF